MANRPILYLLLALLVISAFINSGPLLLITILLALTWGASALWGRFALTNLTYQRRLDTTRLTFGEETDLWVEITNAKFLPLAWLRIDDEWPENLPVIGLALPPSGQPRRRLLTNLLSMRWYERVRRHYRIRGERRGLFQLGPVKLTSGDMFGFRTQSVTLSDAETIIVHPRTVPIAQLGLRHARPFGDSRTRRRLYTDPLKIAGARAYTPGDNPRHIHWKATARQNALQTRLFDPGAEPQVLLFLNTHTSEFGYQGVNPDLFELVITIAASLASDLSEDRLPLGLFANGNQPGAEYYIRLPAARRPDQLLRVLDTLAGLSYVSVTPFDTLLRAELQSLPFGASILVITAIATESILAPLLQMQSTGHPVLLITVGGRPPDHLPPQLDHRHLTAEALTTPDYSPNGRQHVPLQLD